MNNMKFSKGYAGLKTGLGTGSGILAVFGLMVLTLGALMLYIDSVDNPGVIIVVVCLFGAYLFWYD